MAACWGTVDDGIFQERYYPGRVHGTSPKNPDFAGYTAAFGAYGELVETTEQFATALQRALFGGPPALLKLRLVAEPITPSTMLSAIRDEALKPFLPNSAELHRSHPERP